MESGPSAQGCGSACRTSRAAASASVSTDSDVAAEDVPPSVTLLVVSRLPEELLPVAERGLQGTDAVQECGEIGNAVWRRGELEAWIVEQMREFLDGLRPLVGFLPHDGRR